MRLEAVLEVVRRREAGGREVRDEGSGRSGAENVKNEESTDGISVG